MDGGFVMYDSTRGGGLCTAFLYRRRKGQNTRVDEAVTSNG